MQSIVIDVRDLQAENMTLDMMLKKAEDRVDYVNQHFPRALKVTEVLSFLMLEDRTGAYQLANAMSITVILAVTDDINNIVKPDLDSVSHVFFMLKSDIQDHFDVSLA